jgi:PhoH-like ATPase
LNDSSKRDRRFDLPVLFAATCGTPRPSSAASRQDDPYRELRMTRGKRIYVLDTNVLMHDPTALFRFEEHDVFIPMTVLEELDAAKKGTSETSRNARQVSRFLNELVVTGNGKPIEDGLELRMPQGIQLDRKPKTGRLYFQTTALVASDKRAARTLPDNLILASVVALREARPKEPVVLVSKDINLRIKAKIYGITAEDYENDRALDDFSLLYNGLAELPISGNVMANCVRGRNAGARSTK